MNIATFGPLEVIKFTTVLSFGEPRSLRAVAEILEHKDKEALCLILAISGIIGPNLFKLWEILSRDIDQLYRVATGLSYNKLSQIQKLLAAGDPMSISEAKLALGIEVRP